MKSLWPLMLVLWAGTTPAAEVCYPVQTEGGQVRFAVDQDKAPFTGNFNRYGGQVCFHDGVVSHIDAWLEPASVDTGLPEVDDALRGPLFFESDCYPRITFVSNEIRPQEVEGSWIVVGTVTVKDQDYVLEVPFTLRQDESARRVRGEIDVERLRYGIGTGEWSNTEWLGGMVTLHYDVRLGSDAAR